MATPYFQQVEKAPGDTLDYGFDWNGSTAAGGPWLATGDTIATSTWTPASGINTSGAAISGAVTSVFISGGTLGSTYDVVNTITTTGGRTKVLTLRVKIVTH